MERRETKMTIDSTQVNSKKDDLQSDLFEERIKRRKDKISQVLYTKRKIHQMQFQPFQDIIKKYPAPEVLKDIQKGQIQDIQMEEEIQQEEIERKHYARVDQYHKKSKKRSKKRCWFCKSHNHLKANCPEIKCFYCGKRGHIKANCYKKKIDYIFARLKETYKKKDINEERKRRHKKRIKQRKLELKIIDFRAKYMSSKLEKSERGEKFFIYWKNIKLGEYTGNGLPQQAIKPLQEHQYEKRLIFKLLRKETPLRNFTLYEGLSNFCGCGEIDLGPEVFKRHVKCHHKNIIPANSQLNRPFWYDLINFESVELEEKFGFTLSNLDEFV